jgi:hypothetical protein
MAGVGGTYTIVRGQEFVDFYCHLGKKILTWVKNVNLGKNNYLRKICQSG